MDVDALAWKGKGKGKGKGGPPAPGKGKGKGKGKADLSTVRCFRYGLLRHRQATCVKKLDPGAAYPMLKGAPQVRGRTPQQFAAGARPQQQQPRFTGSCYACGTAGHRAADCRKVLALEVGEDNNDDTVESVIPPYEEEKNWVMNVGPGVQNDETMIMVDSG
eukprot:16406047-Heterocapsa_arctica.AAC.1